MASFNSQINILLDSYSEAIRFVDGYVELMSNENAGEEKTNEILNKYFGADFVNVLNRKVATKEDMALSFPYLPINVDETLTDLAWNVAYYSASNKNKVWLRNESGEIDFAVLAMDMMFYIDPHEKSKKHIRLKLAGDEEEIASILKYAILTHAFSAAGYTIGENLLDADLEDAIYS